ncbi:HAD-IA family hydrolase [archaeon]|jgi:putative hydrolase of the HAD superfamily|nr:HAD-IA family hydrolase [archaeon]MBT6697548.1 HAD-IA family hydrolase [archaeon]
MNKTIIFDFAGVITTTALFSRVATTLAKKKEIDREFFLNQMRDHEKQYLIGKMSTKEFWKKSCENTTISYEEFQKEISYYEINFKILSLIKKLKNKYEIAILSDNYEALYDTIKKDKRMENLFQHSFYSHLVQASKMNDEEKIFKLALKEMQKQPENCIFIDDKEKNLIAPKKMGMQTIHFKSAEQLEKELEKLEVY